MYVCTYVNVKFITVYICIANITYVHIKIETFKYDIINTFIFPINIVTRRSPLVKTIMLKTTSNHSVVLSRFPKVLLTNTQIVSKDKEEH